MVFICVKNDSINHFKSSVEKYFQFQRVTKKAFLSIDKALTHSGQLESSGSVQFLLSNVASVINPIG